MGVPHAITIDGNSSKLQREYSRLLVSTLEHLQDWPMKSVAAFRNTLMGDGPFFVNPVMLVDDTAEIDLIMTALRGTISEGRMIDFGFVSNEVIKTTSLASRQVFEANELPHPFENWLGLMAWE